MALSTVLLPERYAGGERIAVGGMGEIFLAEDRELGRRVAIKVLAAGFAANEALRRRFEREAMTAAKLSGHSNIVTIYDVAEFDGRPMIVMEYLAGGTLADRLRSAPIPPETAVTWLADAANALDYAHERRVVHRDVKPANLLLDDRGHVHVGDFGIARVVDETTGGLTAAGTIMGTAGYLAPEQARGDRATAASDRYALGVVAYELLTGARPFARSSPTAEAAAHIHEPVPPASQRAARVPVDVDAVFERALAKDPAQRYPTARQLVDGLRHALQPREDVTRILPVPRLSKPMPGPPAGDPARGRRQPYVPALVGALVLAAAVAGALVATMLSSGSSGTATTLAAQTTPNSITVTKTITQPGTTIVQRTTTTLPAQAPPATTPAGRLSVGDAARLNDQAYGLMRAGRYSEALPLLERAVQALRGVGFPYEAYANYNLGYTLLQLGRCGAALGPLQVADELENASAVDDAIARAGRCD